MKNIKFLAVLVITGCILFSSSCKTEKLPDKVGKEELKEEVFSFDLRELGGAKFVKSEEFSGKPMFVDFWATWCPPCRSAAPYIEELHTGFENKVHVIGINLDRNVSNALKFVEKNSISYLQLEGTASGMVEQYAISGIPTFFITDANGKIVKRYVGFRRDYFNEWVKILNRLTR